MKNIYETLAVITSHTLPDLEFDANYSSIKMKQDRQS